MLAAVAHAFNQDPDSPDGQSSIDVLLRSAPSNLSVLFIDVGVNPDGTIPVGSILQNLAQRPVAEQRRVLHQAMLDTINRALSLAADELPDEQLDEVLESVQGYRQRLGS